MNKTAFFFLLAAPASSFCFGFSDIVNWTGTGSNRAAMVLDWNDGTADRSLAWGFRWDGTKTAEDMLRAIDGNDPRLTLSFTFYSGLGYALTQATYDRDLNGTPEHDEGGFNAGTPGYWAYYIGNSPTAVPTWSSSDFGISGVTLENNDWDGLSWAPNFVDGPPADPQAAPVPEPLTFFALAGLLAISRKRQPR